MNKSKYEPNDYFSFYNAAFAAYTNTVLGANALMLECTVAAARTMLRATALLEPVAPAVASRPRSATSQTSAREPLIVAPGPPQELAQLEASLYHEDPQPDSARTTVDKPAIPASTIELANGMLETTVSPQSNGSKKAGTRRRRGKK